MASIDDNQGLGEAREALREVAGLHSESRSYQLSFEKAVDDVILAAVHGPTDGSVSVAETAERLRYAWYQEFAKAPSPMICGGGGGWFPEETGNTAHASPESQGEENAKRTVKGPPPAAPPNRYLRAGERTCPHCRYGERQHLGYPSDLPKVPCDRYPYTMLQWWVARLMLTLWPSKRAQYIIDVTDPSRNKKDQSIDSSAFEAEPAPHEGRERAPEPRRGGEG